MTRYTVLIDGKAGGYGVVFPDLPGCTAMGTTIDAALANAADVLRDWVEVTLEDGGPVPDPTPPDILKSDPTLRQALAEGAALASVPLVRATGRPVKANLSIDAGVLSAIDAEAARRKLTRSAFIELLARHALPELAG